MGVIHVLLASRYATPVCVLSSQDVASVVSNTLWYLGCVVSTCAPKTIFLYKMTQILVLHRKLYRFLIFCMRVDSADSTVMVEFDVISLDGPCRLAVSIFWLGLLLNIAVGCVGLLHGRNIAGNCDSVGMKVDSCHRRRRVLGPSFLLTQALYWPFALRSTPCPSTIHEE